MLQIKDKLLHWAKKLKAMKKHHYLILILTVIFMGFTSDKPAYVLYDQDGKEVKYSKMIKALEEADMIFFGELHTDPIAHWLQIELTKELYKSKKEALVLGAEMFEADNQLILNEYLEGKYPTDKFEAEMRLWGNYHTDYKPLVEFAKEHQIPFIATNIPRRYASMVHKKGFESLEGLTDEAKSYMAPLPMRYDPEVKCYKDMLNMMEMGKEKPGEGEMPGGKMPGGEKTMPAGEKMPGGEKTMPAGEKMPGGEKTMPAGEKMPAGGDAPHGMPPGGMGKSMPSMENLPKAQAAKDATMAHFILQNWSEGKTMFHFNGSYHSDNFEGIVWHLRQQRENLKIITIGSVLQKDIGTLEEENLNVASFILCVPENMTRTKR